LRSVLLLLWATVVVGVVAWSGCSSTVVTGSSSSGSESSTGTTSSTGSSASTGTASSTGSSASTGSASSTGSSTSSSSGMPCNGGPDCNGFEPVGQACPMPGECCPFITCDHMGGTGEIDFLCTDAGVWEQQ
jgi:hypothetical protein